MIIIADSGSTKTSWRFCNEGRVLHSLATIGLNPHTVSADLIDDAIASAAEDLNFYHGEEVERIFFYGAGCGDGYGRSAIESCLLRYFVTDAVSVETDLTGACRALLGDKTGYVGILGTGSNFCYYDPSDNAPSTPFSLGYLLGDEGSGCHIGRLLLREFLRGHLSATLSDALQQQHPDLIDTYRQEIYAGKTPSRYLASFVDFVGRHRSDPQIAGVLVAAFDAYMNEAHRMISQAETITPLNLCGGVAAEFETEVRHAAERAGFHIEAIIADPIDALVRYHQEN